MLVDPPTERRPNSQVAVHQPHHMVGAPAPEDLPMSGVMRQEPVLREGHGQERRRDQLPPRVSD
jgi:hypothetical protein